MTQLVSGLRGRHEGRISASRAGACRPGRACAEGQIVSRNLAAPLVRLQSRSCLGAAAPRKAPRKALRLNAQEDQCAHCTGRCTNTSSGEATHESRQHVCVARGSYFQPRLVYLCHDILIKVAWCIWPICACSAVLTPFSNPGRILLREVTHIQSKAAYCYACRCVSGGSSWIL